MKALSRTHSHESDIYLVADVASDILIKLRECVLQQKKEKEILNIMTRSDNSKERYR